MDLNIRNIPSEVMLKLKVASAQSGMTLRQYCLSKLMDEPKQVSRPTMTVTSVDPVKKEITLTAGPSYYIPAKYRKGTK